MSSGLILLVIIGVVVIYLIMIYNKLVALKNRFKNGFSQIDVQLQRRFDLIPNLVETAKAYMSHEKETLEAVIQARNSAQSARQSAADNPGDGAAMASLMGAEKALTASLGGFFALAESYPDLKADQTMTQLMEELTTTENKVGFARQAYNDAVMEYNTYREQFPVNVLAGFFTFKEAEPYEIDEPEARKAIKVDFN